MATNKTTLKTYFETGDKPTQAQFEELIDAFRHIDDKVSSDDVEGLDAELEKLVTKEAWADKNVELTNLIKTAEVVGVAGPTTVPAVNTDNKPICYFANEDGTYTNFIDVDGNAITVLSELVLLTQTTSGWVKWFLSSTAITSGGVVEFKELNDVHVGDSDEVRGMYMKDGQVYDVDNYEKVGEKDVDAVTTAVDAVDMTSVDVYDLSYTSTSSTVATVYGSTIEVLEPATNGGARLKLRLKFPKDVTNWLDLIVYKQSDSAVFELLKTIYLGELSAATTNVDTSDSTYNVLDFAIETALIKEVGVYKLAINLKGSTDGTSATKLLIDNTASSLEITTEFVEGVYALKHEYMSKELRGDGVAVDAVWGKPSDDEEASMVDLNRLGLQFTQPSPFGVEDEPIQGGVSYVEQTSDPYGGSFSGCCLASNGKVFFAQAGGGPQSMCYDPQTGEVSPINLYSGESFSDAVPIKNGRVIFLCSSSRFSTCLFNANTLELEAINFVPVTSSGYACYNPARDELYFINNLTQLVILDPTSIEVTQQPADVWYLQYQTISGLEDAEYNAVCNAPNNKVVLAPAKSGDPILIIDMADGYSDDLERVTQVAQSLGGYNDCKCTADGRIVFAPADVDGEAPPITILDISDIGNPLLTTVDSYTTVFAANSCCVTATNEVFFGREPAPGDFKVLSMDTLTVREIGRDGSNVPSIIGCCLLPDGSVIGSPADSEAKITLISFDQQYKPQPWHNGLYSQ